MSEIVYSPWPWYVAGPLIAMTMLLLLWVGKRFGVSSNLRTLCAIGGAGAVVEFFRFDWRSQTWNLMFIGGTIIGGYIAAFYLSDSREVVLASDTVMALEQLGFQAPGADFLPDELFGLESGLSLKAIVILLIGGVLVGFGARYAGGCTSGHAISGLSELQIPSLLAVVGFFIGGLTMVYGIMPLIF